MHLTSGKDLSPPILLCHPAQQVILNLVSNAARFTEVGRITVEAEQRDGHITVSVADTGPGIASDDRKRIFEPFRQLDGSISRRHGGSGLGLNISKRFVEMHGGKMWLESPSGLRGADDEALAAQDLSGKRVLVIVPDTTRTAPIPLFYRLLTAALGKRTKALHFLVALGTHQALPQERIDRLNRISRAEGLQPEWIHLVTNEASLSQRLASRGVASPKGCRAKGYPSLLGS